MSPSSTDYERALRAKGLGDIAVFHHRSTGSTNDDARAITSSEAWSLQTGLAIVIAETQTKGRGRGSNMWLSPEGSIALTLTVPGVEVARLSVLPLGAGAAVVMALRNLGARAAVKWPNDVLIDGGKVSGILCESSLLMGIARVFVGIGINVNPRADDLSASPHATSLAAHGITVDRTALVADLASRVLGVIGACAERTVAEWKSVSIPWWGEEVTFKEGDIVRRASVLDVSPAGHLVIRDERGVVRSLVSGEVRQLRAVRK